MPSPPITSAPTPPLLSPSQFVRVARELLEQAFDKVALEGEICNLARPGSGHLYFALKDANAQVRCAMFKNRTLFLRFRPAEGMLVQLSGRASLYEGRGEFQLIVDSMQPAGAGALRQAFEALKAKLAAEGLFDDALKRPLPKLPRRIGLLTSATGAAVHDVLSVLARRFALVEVELLPVPVQGPDAATRIIATLERAGASGRYDLLLLTRGGGSPEDLAAFNHEGLARAIRAAPVPVVAAIGHEVDFTIADFVADLRAATPSAAAERIVPARDQFELRLRHLRRRAADLTVRALRDPSQRLDSTHARLQLQAPGQRLRRARERLTALAARLGRTPQQWLRSRRLAAATLRQRLLFGQPGRRVELARDRVDLALRSCGSAWSHAAGRRRASLASLARALNAISPLATLERGYSISLDPESRRVVRSVEQTAVGQKLLVRLHDGELGLTVDAVNRETGSG
jgi:exodeoxyribonuclease VII large subunit